MLLDRKYKIGSCYLRSGSGSNFCGLYFKSNNSSVVSWSGKGWPVNQASGDSTGCIAHSVAPQGSEWSCPSQGFQWAFDEMGSKDAMCSYNPIANAANIVRHAYNHESV